MKNIKVSIVTPAYNNEKYIEETINSILNQTHQNFEIIVVDDYSSDKTIELVENLMMNES